LAFDPSAAELIRIDIDPPEIGRNYQAPRSAGDATTTLDALALASSPSSATAGFAHSWAHIEMMGRSRPAVVLIVINNSQRTSGLQSSAGQRLLVRLS
jgi:hypothetical protein